jgi:hypothetical protein
VDTQLPRVNLQISFVLLMLASRLRRRRAFHVHGRRLSSCKPLELGARKHQTTAAATPTERQEPTVHDRLANGASGSVTEVCSRLTGGERRIVGVNASPRLGLDGLWIRDGAEEG